MAPFNMFRCRFWLLLILITFLSVPAVASKLDDAKHLLLTHNYKQAAPLFLTLARDHQPAAQWHMAQLYQSGFGVEKNIDKSLYWLQEAAKSKHVKSMYQLGVTYLRGILVAKNKTLARKWLSQAAENGSIKAEKALHKLNASHDALPESFEQLVKACESGDMTLVSTLSQKSLMSLSPQGVSILWPVVQAHEFEMAKVLLEKGLKLNHRDQYGQTLLHERVLANDDIAIEWLLGQGIITTTQDDFGNTPLHLSVIMPLIRISESLVKASSSLNITNQKGETALDRALLNSQSGWIDLLKKFGAKALVMRDQRRGFAEQALVNAARENKIPPLHWAAQKGDLDMVKRFYSDEQAHAQDRSEQTPLQRATRAGQLPVVKWLIEKAGIDNEVEADLLPIAIQRKHVDVARYLVQVVNNPKQLMDGFQASIEQSLPEISQILFQKLEASAPPEHWLLELARHHQFKLATKILNSVQDVNLEDDEGRTALWYSLSAGAWNLSEQLLKRGAQTGHKDKQGSSGLHAWMVQADGTGVERLYRLKIDLTLPNKEGLQPLLLGVINNRLEAVQALLSKDVAPNSRDHYGNTALMLAVKSGKIKMVRLLLSAGAEIRLRNKNKKSAQNMAEELGYKKISELLSKEDKSLFSF